MNAAPKTLDDLAGLSIWVGWKIAERGGKLTKVPFNPETGRMAESNNRTTWATRPQAERWASRNGGQTGIVLAPIGDDWHLGGIDLDTCRDPESGIVEPWAREVIARFGSYTEVSPSSTGVKTFFLYPLSAKGKLTTPLGKKLGRQFKRRSGGDRPPAIEIYIGNRYFAVTTQTSEAYAELRVATTENFRWLIEDAGPRFVGAKEGAEKSGAGKGKPRDDSRSGRAFREGARLRATGTTYEEMREGLLYSSDPEVATWVNEKGLPYNERELRNIYDHARAGGVPGFEMREDGLHCHKGSGERAYTVWICAPFEIIGESRDPDRGGWGLFIRWRDDDGRTHTDIVNLSESQSEPGKLCAKLADAGLRIDPAQQKDFARYLAKVKADTRVTVVKRTGWHDIDGRREFVLPDGGVSEAEGERIMFDPSAAVAAGYEKHGSLEGWKSEVAPLARGHVVPTFMLSAAFAGPLLDLGDFDGAGVHCQGDSSSGKTSAGRMAASVWGNPSERSKRAFVKTWRATANSLEGAAELHSDTVLILDELGQVEAKALSQAVYMLANGSGKGRANREGDRRISKTWRTMTC
jgi:hypothetical protein